MRYYQSIAELMTSANVPFGTSGVRGRVTDMTDAVCYAYTLAFIQHLQEVHELPPNSAIGLAGDFRSSTPRIMAAVALAIHDCGYTPVNCGTIPSPAITYYGIKRQIPTIMVTGSHIPEDRNGIKFSLPVGEILKEDEAGIRKQIVTVPKHRFDASGALIGVRELPPPTSEALSLYVDRYLDFFPPNALSGLRIGLYAHSTVARDSLNLILTSLGAEVTQFGYSEQFVPVDTEAIRPEDIRIARQWANTQHCDCIVSADGDGDRPLISDETGAWLRGDVAGVLCAAFLGIDTVVTPVSSNTCVELSGWFTRVLRTRIGSPFVIEAMLREVGTAARVAGYEANGGFLLASPVHLNGATLDALPTRDALLVIISVITLAKQRRATISRLLKDIPARFTASDRITGVPSTVGAALLARLRKQDHRGRFSELEHLFANLCGPVLSVDNTDGLRTTFENGEIIHLRPSGNAPEFRCYCEAASHECANDLLQTCMRKLREQCR